jgi:hypothetical protein
MTTLLDPALAEWRRECMAPRAMTTKALEARHQLEVSQSRSELETAG